MAVEVWLLLPEDARRQVGQTLRAIDLAVQQQSREGNSWTLVTRYVRTFKVRGGRPLPVLSTEDSANLYRRAHRARVGVLVVGEAWVRSDPSEEPDVGPGSLNVQQFLAYKALVGTTRTHTLGLDYAPFLERVEEWVAQVHCDGAHDPRCLPRQVFDAGDFQGDLGEGEARDAFARRFGGSPRVDDRRLRWKAAVDRHGGREPLNVAGRELALGVHWDVEPDRAEARICTTNQVWKVSRFGYVNVYPDAYVRDGEKCRLVWPG